MTGSEDGFHQNGRRVISKSEHEARKVFRDVETKKAISDNASEKQAFADNHQRLRAERHAREAAAQPAATEEPNLDMKAE